MTSKKYPSATASAFHPGNLPGGGSGVVQYSQLSQHAISHALDTKPEPTIISELWFVSLSGHHLIVRGESELDVRHAAIQHWGSNGIFSWVQLNTDMIQIQSLVKLLAQISPVSEQPDIPLDTALIRQLQIANGRWAALLAEQDSMRKDLTRLESKLKELGKLF